jgi:hypothetical protein
MTDRPMPPIPKWPSTSRQAKEHSASFPDPPPKKSHKKKPVDPEAPKRDRSTEQFKKQQNKEIEALDLASAKLTLDQLTCLIAGVEFGVETAALRLGWTVEKVEAELRKPECAFTIKMARDMLFRDIVKAKVRALRKISADRKSFGERLMELAYMDPSETKGSIDGQVKAVKVLLEYYGGRESDPLKDKSTDELQEIVRQGHLILEGAKPTGPVQ